MKGIKSPIKSSKKTQPKAKYLQKSNGGPFDFCKIKGSYWGANKWRHVGEPVISVK